MLIKKSLVESEINILSHLKSRGIKDFNGIHVDQESGDTFFTLYNFSGQIVGYQKYNPNYPKGSDLFDKNRYFNLNNKSHNLLVWGIQSFHLDEHLLFLTEGIFDAVKIHNAGYPAFAILGNNPLHLRSWINTLNRIVVVIYDNDSAGQKLKKFGDFAYSVDDGKDLGDLTQSKANAFIENIIKDIIK